jgi:hypothetical protein
MIRDSEGRFLSSDVIEGIHSFLLLERGCSSPNITNIHLNSGFYKTEFTHIGKTDIGYVEVPEYWVKSYIRNKKINKIIE